MPSFHRNGSSQLNDRRRTRASSSSTPTTLLIKNCFRYPKLAKALFVVVLFSWVAFVALFLSSLPTRNPTNATMTPLTARENLTGALRGLRAKVLRRNDANKDEGEKTDTKKRNARVREKKGPNTLRKDEHNSVSMYGSVRDTVAVHLLAKLPYNRQTNEMKGLPQPKNLKEHQEQLAREIKENRANKAKEARHKEEHNNLESLEQSTKDALETSQPFVQTSADVVSPPGQDSIYSFAHEQYYNTDSMIRDNDDSMDGYFASDDDAARGKEYKGSKHCSTPEFYRLYHPTCNDVHSDVSGPQWLVEHAPQHTHRSRFLAAGGYRQVFLLERQFASGLDEVIFKSMKRLPRGKGTLEERAVYNPEEVYHNFELYDDMRKDSMVMEQLTSSPWIANIYSFCALSSIIEYAPGNIEKYVMPTEGEIDDDARKDDPTPVNDSIPPVEKLEMALQLAKGLAVMHGYSDGVIANGDVQIGQFCRGKDGLIKVLDFNRAEVMLYDTEREKYCGFENGPPPDGTLRSPEEIIDAPLNEKIDVYSIGNVFYSILTGLFVYREYEIDEAHHRIKHGITEKIDVGFFESRSPAEMVLVKVIQWCWTFDVYERPSIFQIVKFLEDEIEKT